MKIRGLSSIVAGLSLAILATPAWAGSVIILSPDKAQAHAFGHVTKSKFIWSEKERALFADITFSVGMYAGSGQSNEQESFLFKFPGVTFDPSTKTFYARDKSGKEMAIAAGQSGLFGRSVKPLPGTCVYICKKHGEVQVVLTASTSLVSSDDSHHWMENDDEFFLKKLVSE